MVVVNVRSLMCGQIPTRCGRPRTVESLKGRDKMYSTYSSIEGLLSMDAVLSLKNFSLGRTLTVIATTGENVPRSFSINKLESLTLFSPFYS